VSVNPSARYPELDTPSLVIDLDAMERNIAEMAQVARAADVHLRPHTKTHKSPDIAAMQIAAGAGGITVAKIGEAEVMADAGIDDILIAYPIVGDMKLRRLRDLMERASIRVSLDSVAVAEGIGRVGVDRGAPVEVFVEVDTGQHRMGRPPGAPSAELVVEVARVPGVTVAGLLTHEGQAYAARTPQDLDAVVTQMADDLADTKERCEAAGVPIPGVSVGSTPSARAVAGAPGVTEIRPGTYVFNDRNTVALGGCRREDCAATILTTVVSTTRSGQAIIDGGSKTFSSDRFANDGDAGFGEIVGVPGACLQKMNEEHGFVSLPGGAATIRVGDRMSVLPNHICVAVNLHEQAYGVRGEKVEEIWKIEARGKLQ